MTVRRCPLCDGEADSAHHIKPRSEGGSDESRNIVWLCRSCHDRVEGLVFTPALIESERRRIKGQAATQGERYVFMVHESYMVFAGIRVHDNLIPFNIILPRDQPLNDVQITLDLPSEPSLKSKKIPEKINERAYRGRPPKPPINNKVKKPRGRPRLNIEKPVTNRKRGRPRKVISYELAQLLDEDVSLSEKARKTGLSKSFIHKYIKEKRAEYVAA